MSKIIKQDTNGTKALLGVGEFGYDNYPTGGDAGRVYVGNGAENIPQAKKAEVVAVDGKVDTHIVRVDNPHSVTKAQVGLSNVDNTSDVSKPISTSVQNALDLKQNVLVSGTNIKTIEGQSIVGSGNIDLTKVDVGLNNVDNIADSAKVVASASKWTTSRLVNGTAVDGTVDITTSQWGTSRNITIGDTTKSVNGSTNISWSLNEIGAIGTASPAFTGVPTAPTAVVNTNTTQLATTAFVNAEIANDAIPRVTSIDNAIVRFDGTTGNVQNSSITIDDSGNIGSGAETFNGFGGSGFKNLIINGRKQVNQSGLTTTDNSYNYDNHYKVGNNWFMFVDGKNIVSGESYTLSWDGVATAGYYIGTAGSLTINAQTFTTIDNGETITPTITSSQILWIKFASDSSGSTYNKVQFESGTTPTPYEHRLSELEESLVRYIYRKYGNQNASIPSPFAGTYQLPYTIEPMRITPIVTLGQATVAVNVSSIALIMISNQTGFWTWTSIAAGAAYWQVDSVILDARP